MFKYADDLPVTRMCQRRSSSYNEEFMIASVPTHRLDIDADRIHRRIQIGSMAFVINRALLHCDM